MKYEADELNHLEKVQEVFAPQGDFEKPAETFVPGPYYAAAEEVMPEIVEGVAAHVAGDKASSDGQSYPVGRRDFMKLFSLATVAGATACVRDPVEAIVPHAHQPVDYVPGVAVHYATTCASCPCACGVVVKTKEGRPIKLEGSEEHPVSQGALCALGQGDLQGLYHPERLKAPQARFGFKLDNIHWNDAYKSIGEKLKSAKKVGILTGLASGHKLSFFESFLNKFGNDRSNVIVWEPNTLFSAVGKAHELAFGTNSIPRYELDNAKCIVGIGSDFLDIGLSPVYLTKSFSKAFSFNGEDKGRLIQFESLYSLTGSKADERHVIRPGSEWLVSLLLVKSLMEHRQSKGSSLERARIQDVLSMHEAELTSGYGKVGISRDVFDDVAKALLDVPSVVMAGGSGSFDENATLLQLSAVCANILIGAYDSVLMLNRGWSSMPHGTSTLHDFVEHAEEYDVLFVIDSNPVFSTPKTWGVDKALEKVKTVISIQAFPNEVDQFAHYVLPNHHYLESWGDEQPVAGFWSMRQPTVRPLTDSRQAEDMLLWIAAASDKPMPYKDYRTYLQEQWKEIHKTIGGSYNFDTFFQLVLKRGFIGKLATRTQSSLQEIKSHFKNLPHVTEGFVLLSPLDLRLQDGRAAHLPVMQEIADSLTTVTWDSWVALNPNTMNKLGVKRNQVIRVSSDLGWYEASVFPLPGLHQDAVVTHRGNGHEDPRSTVSNGNGVNPLRLFPKGMDPLSKAPKTSVLPVTLAPTQEWYRLAALQKHHDIGNRSDIVKKHTVDYLKHHKEPVDLDTVPDMFPALEVAEHKWGMSIDLEKCTGCNACIVACTLENNIPSVGREQIILGREMHWIRLDRYFYGDMNTPTVTFQPVMCQHCNHAPCEAVCPVFATTHDPEGMNAITYNRCVGTRYCANACPYKVRRFNWWTHKWNEMGSRLQDRNPRPLNPDVTVRTRGVVEKCSFCVGRLRDAKHQAKQEHRTVVDGEAKTACQQTCPADAITFGNLKDKQSKIAHARKDPRAYLMLGGDPKHGHYGIKTLPSVNYLAAVVHTAPEAQEEHTDKKAEPRTHG